MKKASVHISLYSPFLNFLAAIFLVSKFVVRKRFPSVSNEEIKFRFLDLFASRRFQLFLLLFLERLQIQEPKVVGADPHFCQH